jgi:ATP-binding protein involved in chromosome partitioning
MDNDVKRGNIEVPYNYGLLREATANERKSDVKGEIVEFWVNVKEDLIEKVTFISEAKQPSLKIASEVASLVEKLPLKEAISLIENQIKEASDFKLFALNGLKSVLEKAELKTLKAKERIILSETPATKKSHQRRTIMVMSGKGGVGKSTVAVNLALSLAAQGKRVGLVDVDIHGPSIPTMLNLTNVTVMQAADGIQPLILGDLYNLEVMSVGFLLEHDDDPVIWRGPLKNSLIEQFLNDVAWGPLDYLFIDCPPGTGDEPLSVAQQLKEKAEAILVTTPQQVAVSDVARSVNFCRQMKMPLIGVIENMASFVCPNCNTITDIFRTGGGKNLAERYNIPLLGSIPIDPSFGVTADAGYPFVVRYNDSPIAMTYKEIVNKLDQGETI